MDEDGGGGGERTTGSGPVDGLAGADGPGFRVHLSDGRVLDANYVCIACGGYPKSTMFQWIQRTGHTTEEPVPSLFTFNMPGHSITQLMGVSVPDAQVRSPAPGWWNGSLLITHWGLSGPVILRLSAWAPGAGPWGLPFSILVNWIPEFK